MQNQPFFAWNRMRCFASLLQTCPAAAANIAGSDSYPDICGRAYFYQTKWGVLTAVQVFGLPSGKDTGRRNVFACHIHSGGHCSGMGADAFADAMSHYNPEDLPHPYHAGDLPPLFENGGYAFSVVLTDRFSLREIVGKTLIIHRNPDDFTTQPSGNSGEKIACGQIQGFFRL